MDGLSALPHASFNVRSLSGRGGKADWWGDLTVSGRRVFGGSEGFPNGWTRAMVLKAMCDALAKEGK